MYKLKTLSKEAVEAALEKAKRYRQLRESVEAESICLDILEIEPDHQEALITLVKALTDQFETRLTPMFRQAFQLIPRLHDEYSRLYYSGVICERRAKAHMKPGGCASGHCAYDWFCKAMEFFEQAEAIRPPSNDEAILRWNACARILMHRPDVVPAPELVGEQMLE